MNKLLIAISLGLGLFTTQQSKSQSVDSALTQTYTAFDTSKTYSQLQLASMQFKLIAKQYPNNWLTNYYAAWSLAQLSFQEPQQDKKDIMLDEADAFFNKIESMDSSNDEIAVLGGLLAQARMVVAPVIRFDKYSPIRDTYFALAGKTNPNNPRMYYIQGMNIFYTPAAFGGGKKNALPLLEKAKTFFANDDENDIRKPHWGKQENEKLLNACTGEVPVQRRPAGKNYKIITQLYSPADTASGGKIPVIICLGGSEGGLLGGELYADYLSKNHYIAIAVAYFGTDSLPQELANIPLEYFERVFKYVKSIPHADTNKIGVIGGSKGAELSLILASRYPSVIKAVIAESPGYCVFQGITPSNWMKASSSWSYNNTPLPYVPTVYNEKFAQSGKLIDLYSASLEQTDYVEKAMIEVEKINGPVLLVSGKQDEMWPTSMMCDKMMERFKKNDFKFPYKHLDYDNAGHCFSSQLGGTDEGNAKAQTDFKNQILIFLKQAFK